MVVMAVNTEMLSIYLARIKIFVVLTHYADQSIQWYWLFYASFYLQLFPHDFFGGITITYLLIRFFSFFLLLGGNGVLPLAAFDSISVRWEWGRRWCSYRHGNWSNELSHSIVAIK